MEILTKMQRVTYGILPGSEQTRVASTPMSTTAEEQASEPLPTQTRTLTGWGRTAPTTAEVLSTPDV